jgi:hypothetical protein
MGLKKGFHVCAESYTASSLQSCWLRRKFAADMNFPLNDVIKVVISRKKIQTTIVKTVFSFAPS